MSRTYKNELAESVDLPMSFSNWMLEQFAFADVHLYTNSFARVACAKYKPSTSGERLFNHCLTDIQLYFAADDQLQFGWDELSIYRNHELHKYEYEHFLLASALGECLPEAYAAAVLSCLGQRFEDTRRLNPPLSQWKAFVRSVNGLVTTTDFALLIDERMQLDPYRVCSGHSTTCTNSLVAPSQFAKSLEALGNLSLAGQGQLTLAGGNFLGWFAAFAELFLGMNVQISSRDGQILHTTKGTSNAQLHLVFVDDINNLTPTVQAQSSQSLTLTVMCGADARPNEIPRVPFTGRVSWEALLPKVFEHSFHKLAHQESKILVQSLGGCARLFQLVAEDPSSGEDVIAEENRHNQGALGMGLVQTICNWFPELRHLQGRLERLQKLTRDEATNKCEIGAKGLIDLCGCTICATVGLYTDHDPEVLPQSFCLLAIMETILNLALAMSRITVVPKMYPSRAGVMCIYQRQVQKLLKVKAYTTNKKPFDRFKTLFGEDWNANYSHRLQHAVAIFSGSWPQRDLPENLGALTHEGVCAYVVALLKGRSTKQDDGLIRVQNGHVAWRQKAYDRVCWKYPEGVAQDDYTWEGVRCKHLPEDIYFK